MQVGKLSIEPITFKTEIPENVITTVFFISDIGKIILSGLILTSLSFWILSLRAESSLIYVGISLYFLFGTLSDLLSSYSIISELENFLSIIASSNETSLIVNTIEIWSSKIGSLLPKSFFVLPLIELL